MRSTQRKNPWRTFGIFAVVLGAAVALSAWSWQAPSSDDDASAVTTPEPVQVSVAEDSLALSSETLPAGSATFEVTNEGTEPHSFAVTGPVDERLESEVTAGETETLEATLEPGTYTAYCPLEGHSEQESVEFTVGQ